MSINQESSAGEQLNVMRARLTDQLLRKEKLAKDSRECNEQIDALTNFLAGAEIGARDVFERAQKAEAAKKEAAAAAEKIIGTATVDGQVIPLIDDTGQA